MIVDSLIKARGSQDILKLAPSLSLSEGCLMSPFTQRFSH